MIRRVAGAALLPLLIALTAPSTAADPLPAGAKREMTARIGRYGFYPASVPAGLRFVGWKVSRLKPAACGQNLDITFTGSVGELDWASSRDCGDGGITKCYDDGYPGYDFEMSATQTARINGRRVFFSTGNHGSNAWACIPLTRGDVKDMAVVGLWESNFMTPQQAMNLVATSIPR